MKGHSATSPFYPTEYQYTVYNDSWNTFPLIDTQYSQMRDHAMSKVFNHCIKQLELSEDNINLDHDEINSKSKTNRD